MLERGVQVDHTTLYRWVQRGEKGGAVPEVIDDHAETFAPTKLAGQPVFAVNLRSIRASPPSMFLISCRGGL
jgi:hypothetical protein